MRAEPGVALHRHVPDEPPVGAQRHAARRPPHQRRARRPRARLRAGALRLHRHERRPPHRRRPTTPGSAPTRACSPASTRSATSPRATRSAWLDWMRAAGVDVPDDWRAFVDQPAAGTRWRTQYDAKHTQTVFLTDRLLDFVDDRSAAGTPWFAHVSYLRPHPPFLAPAPYDTMFDPASVPAPVRAATRAEEGAQHPLLGVMIDHPFLASPDDDAGAARAAGDLLRDDGRGRRPARPRSSTGSTRSGVASTHARGAHVGSRRDARRPLAHAQARLVRPDVPRAADRPRPARSRSTRRAAASSTRSPSTSTCCRRSPSCSTPRCRCSATAARSRRGSTARRPPTGAPRCTPSSTSAIPTAQMFEDAFGLTLEECSLAVLRDDHGKYVHFSGHPTLPPIFFDLDADPAQIVNRAADPAYARDGARLRAAHARVAHAPHRTHAHRHEAHQPRRPRRSAAPRR